MRRAVQYALRKGVDVIVSTGEMNLNLDDPKFDSISPDNGTAADVIQNRPVDLVSTFGGGNGSVQYAGLLTRLLCLRFV